MSSVIVVTSTGASTRTQSQMNPTPGSVRPPKQEQAW